MGLEVNGMFWRRYRPSPAPSLSVTPAAGGEAEEEAEEEEAKRPETDDTHDTSANAWNKVGLRDRIRHLTWANFTFPMSTGGIALLLTATPHRFRGLETLGKIAFLFDLVIFFVVCAGIAARFIMNPGSFQKSLVHPTEALFFATFWLALVDVLGCMQDYGVPNVQGDWLVVFLRVAFWIYVALTFLTGVLQYLHLFTAKKLTIQSMTPGWILPMFPTMLAGTFATLIAPSQPIGHREPIIIAGLTFQGLGWMLSFMIYAIYLHRLIQFGLPAPDLRPGMFIAVGPPAFTGLALIGLSQALPPDGSYFRPRPGIIPILQTLADGLAIFLWSLSFWFFCVALLSVLRRARDMSFHLVWWAFVFPNVGFTIATIKIGQQLGSEGILWVASAMTVLLVVVWGFVFVSHMRAIWKRQIMMPGLDEDKDQYKADDRRLNIPVPPTVPPTPQHLD
ncbi:malic acid transport [Lecanosticta acicola]|uniref:Malic acid transport n=1 Tax=Lecanosticta acicola TaxID=111012 RepID=A0AAI8VVL2_9PEZI|nr:malic acid transport [Lecanosticta acicola]